MAGAALHAQAGTGAIGVRPRLHRWLEPRTAILFLLLLAAERKQIKRVPVVKDGTRVGVVSRSNLIQALASAVARIYQHDKTDRQIRLETAVPAAKTIVDRFRKPERHG
jgi:signal-transduction protein with cAMP-binding, CBS, and nucleotidyltransferase domain